MTDAASLSDPPSLDDYERAALARLAVEGESLRGTLRLARALTEAQRAVDLTALDAGMGRLCAQVLDLSPPAARTMRPRLVTLLEELDALAAAMRRSAPQD